MAFPSLYALILSKEVRVINIWENMGDDGDIGILVSLYI